MDHAITVGEVLLGAGCLFGVLIAVGLAVWALSIFASGFDH